MQEVVYHSNFEIEETYFWFIARRKIVYKIFKKITGLPAGSQVIDIGCGTGGFAAELAREYKVAGLDMEPLALEYCRRRGLTDLHNTTVAGFPREGRNIRASFMLDVIEHIDDDLSVVKEVYDLLPAGGWMIATVPAYNWLWSRHDELHMHYRRHTRKSIRTLLEKAGFSIRYSSYFNTFLFPAAVAKRFLDKLTGKDKKHNDPVDKVSDMMNRLFTGIFSAEAAFLPFIRFPFGLSVIVIAQKN